MLDHCVIFGGKIGSNTTPFISIFLHTSLIHVHSLLKHNVNEWKSYEYIFLFCYLIRKLSVRDDKFYARNESASSPSFWRETKWRQLPAA